ncbi:MAG: NUDIX hydrolase [Actinobacteria bacterium]|jgi:8-oxo-dGTP diphosphatase|nr:NUDIX hydrolase [Actinomycetota bacterium]NCW34666.1 NUDIX hydrolase [Actinomycetota bacterium]NCZ73122.1 NUDIX hydrolase [Actinomycetota bacterium]NDA41064.1 NUDIX hydrolase [Actinomycetota bacterium]NDB31034.1 NUDIX hydrolase [Actinomycetota bacterium]
MEESNVILAGGAVVWRRNEDDLIEIALVHRVKYDDWSLPKGKVESQESVIACAFREVMEETGFSVRFGPCLGTHSYSVENATKKVTYWSAKFLKEIGVPNPQEVDQIRWITLDQVDSVVTRVLDREVIRQFRNFDPDSKALILMRHAQALDRNDWSGEDCDRPLNTYGERQAKRVLLNFQSFEIEEIHSSSAVRCYESVSPMARALNIGFFFTDSLSEDVYMKDKERPFKYIQRLLMNDYSTLVCSHNPIIPRAISSFVDKFGVEISDTKLEPGDAWIVHHIDREVIAVDYLPAPKV